MSRWQVSQGAKQSLEQGAGWTECPVCGPESRVGHRAPLSAEKASSPMPFCKVKPAAACSKHPPCSHGRVARDSCAPSQRWLDTFASPRAGRRVLSETGIQTVGKWGGGGCCSSDLPATPISCHLQDCGGGCKRRHCGDRGGICGHSVPRHETANHPVFHNW